MGFFFTHLLSDRFLVFQYRPDIGGRLLTKQRSFVTPYFLKKDAVGKRRNALRADIVVTGSVMRRERLPMRCG
jgi:hypothetical protein